MQLRNALALLLVLLFAGSASAESNSNTIGFSQGNLVGSLSFTALDPNETSSGFAPFAGYTQTATSLYTYLYLLENDSAVGTPTSFGDTNNFIGLDIELGVDPASASISGEGHDGTNGGEAPSDAFSDSIHDLVVYFFDDAPNYGILPDGGFSAFLRFYSPFAPDSLAGAFITNNEGPPDDFVHITSGVVAPVPEPGTAALLGLGLLALGARRRR